MDRTYCAVMFFNPSGANTIMIVRISVMVKMTLRGLGQSGAAMWSSRAWTYL